MSNHLMTQGTVGNPTRTDQAKPQLDELVSAMKQDYPAWMQNMPINQFHKKFRFPSASVTRSSGIYVLSEEITSVTTCPPADIPASSCLLAARLLCVPFPLGITYLPVTLRSCLPGLDCSAQGQMCLSVFCLPRTQSFVAFVLFCPDPALIVVLIRPCSCWYGLLSLIIELGQPPALFPSLSCPCLPCLTQFLPHTPKGVLKWTRQ